MTQYLDYFFKIIFVTIVQICFIICLTFINKTFLIAFTVHSFTKEQFMFSSFIKALLMTVILALAACSTSPPKGVSVVPQFELQRYLGNWYEIARLDHSFEKGMTHTSANYTVNPDGSIQVLNRGYDTNKNEWSQAIGKALPLGNPNVPSLKVSFFGPFYGGYHVFALDPEYRWALVVGSDLDYFWLLSRDKTLSPELRAQLVAQAKSIGIRTEKLIWVDQSASQKDPKTTP